MDVPKAFGRTGQGLSPRKMGLVAVSQFVGNSTQMCLPANGTVHPSPPWTCRGVNMCRRVCEGGGCTRPPLRLPPKALPPLDGAAGRFVPGTPPCPRAPSQHSGGASPLCGPRVAVSRFVRPIAAHGLCRRAFRAPEPPPRVKRGKQQTEGLQGAFATGNDPQAAPESCRATGHPDRSTWPAWFAVLCYGAGWQWLNAALFRGGCPACWAPRS